MICEICNTSGMGMGCICDECTAKFDALTREAEEARAGWDASEARFDADIEAARADLDAIIIAQAERIAKLTNALEIAKIAMAERRSYVNGGDPSGCWQEMKYGTIWDEEDAQVAAALAPKEQ